MTCDSCGLPLIQSRLVNSVFLVHECRTSKDVLRAMACPHFGKNAAEIGEPDIPAIWRTTGHWQTVWDRSK